VKTRLALLVALALALSLPIAGTAATHRRKPALRTFSYTATGTNSVNITTGELSEHWQGTAKPFGRITADVAGTIQRPTPATLTVQITMTIHDPRGDLLIGTCIGSGILPNPDGYEDWTCEAVGGTGKFKRSRGHWSLHIDIHRASIQAGAQNNNFTEQGAGRLRWNADARGKRG
jgi:hypothetical protein